ncbi:MAG: hypothetical protein JWN70_3820 [Planctomycetaceae bacterium]|nr:hypothetical protein [Planctomycetaceae bacterium]
MAVAGRARRTFALQLRNVIHFTGDDCRLVRTAIGTVFVVSIQHPPGEGLGKILLMTSLTSSLHHGQVLNFWAQRGILFFLGSNRRRLAAVYSPYHIRIPQWGQPQHRQGFLRKRVFDPLDTLAERTITSIIVSCLSPESPDCGRSTANSNSEVSKAGAALVY